MARKPKLKVVETSAKKNDEQEYFANLHVILDEIYQEATKFQKLTWEDLAKKSDLTLLTVIKLGKRETRFPQFRTVFKLAKAIGWNLKLDNNKKIIKKISKVKAVG